MGCGVGPSGLRRPPGQRGGRMGTRGCAGHGTQAGAGSWLPTARGLHRNPRPGPQRGEAVGSRLPSQANSGPNVGREKPRSAWGCAASQHLTRTLVPSISFLGRNLPSKSKCHKALTSKVKKRAQGWHNARHVPARSIPEQSLICDPCFVHQVRSPKLPGLVLARDERKPPPDLCGCGSSANPCPVWSPW